MRKAAIRPSSSVVVLVALAMAFAVGVINLVQLTSPTVIAANPVPCGPCTHGWVYDSAYMGGVECAHGAGFPDHGGNNPQCRYCYRPINNNTDAEFNGEASCCESHAGNSCLTPKTTAVAPYNYPADYETITVAACTDAAHCKCFDCVANGGCEGIFKSWVAHCGVRQNTPWNPSYCKIKEKPGSTDQDSLSEWIEADALGPNGCAAANPSGGLAQYYFCGFFTGSGDMNNSGSVATSQCVANNCQESATGTWHPQDTGKRMVCDP